MQIFVTFTKVASVGLWDMNLRVRLKKKKTYYNRDKCLGLEPQLCYCFGMRPQEPLHCTCFLYLDCVFVCRGQRGSKQVMLPSRRIVLELSFANPCWIKRGGAGNQRTGCEGCKDVGRRIGWLQLPSIESNIFSLSPCAVQDKR